MTICSLTSAQEDAESLIALRVAKVKDAYWRVFSNDQGISQYGLNRLANSIEKNIEIISNLQNELKIVKKTTGDIKQIGELKKAINLRKDENKESLFKHRDAIKKKPILSRIRSLIINNALDIMDSNMYRDIVDPETQMSVLKDRMETEMSLVFESLADLDSSQLKAFETRVNKVLSKLSQLSKKENPQLSSWGNTMASPEMVVAENDPTGRGFKPMKSAKELAENAHKSRAGYEEILNNIYTGVRSLVEGKLDGGNRYLFMHDIGKRKKVKPEDDAISLDNIWKFIIEAGRGTVRNIQPTPIYNVDANGNRIFTPEFKEDYNIWKKLVNENARNGIGLKGFIQSYYNPDTDQEMYYVAIKKIDEDGKEVYRAYDVPIYTDKKSGRVRIKVAPNIKDPNFYEDFQISDDSSIGGVNRWNPATKSFDNIKGRMPNGWYRAGKHGTVSGTVMWGKGKGKTFTTNSDQNFTYDEDLNSFDSKTGIHDEVWRSLSEIRQMLKSVAQDIRESTELYETRLLAILNKMFPGKDFSSLSRIDVNKMVKEKYGFDVDTLDMNIAIRGDRIFTPNTDFDELFNYMPIMYTDSEKFRIFGEAKKDLQRKVDEAIEDIEALEDPQKKANREIELKEYEEMLKNTDIMLNYITDQSEDLPSFNQVSQIKSTRHRTALSSPLPIYDNIEINGQTINHMIAEGMRLDEGIFKDYLKQFSTAKEQNNVKLDLLEAVVGGMSPAIQNYVVDHVKSAFGRRDIEAGFMRIPYSDRIFGRPFRPGGAVHNFTSRSNKWISANLLKGQWTSVMNNTQRTNYVMLANGEDAIASFNEYAENEDALVAAAAKAGITDEIATLADVLVGNTRASDKYYAGLVNFGHMTYLKLSKSQFIRTVLKGTSIGEKFWYGLGGILASRLDLPTQQAAKAREWALNDIWELTTGLVTGEQYKKGDTVFTPAQMKAIKGKLNGVLNDRVVDSHLKWAFGGSMWTRMWGGEKRGTRWLLTFTEAEKRMRTEAIHLAYLAVDRMGYIPKDYKGNPYEHPLVVRQARIFVNNAMFSMSKANLSKAFKGNIGEVLGKFQPYKWNQLGTEYNTVRNYLNATINHKESTYAERVQSFTRIFHNPQGKIEEQVRNFLLARGIASLLTVVSEIPRSIMWSPAKTGINFVKNLVGYRAFGSFSRGAESQFISIMLRIGFWSLLMGNDSEDDDERISQNIRRFFLPILFNVIYETFAENDPLKPTQIFSRGFYSGTQLIKDVTKKKKPRRRSGRY